MKKTQYSDLCTILPQIITCSPETAPMDRHNPDCSWSLQSNISPFQIKSIAGCMQFLFPALKCQLIPGNLSISAFSAHWKIFALNDLRLRSQNHMGNRTQSHARAWGGKQFQSAFNFGHQRVTVQKKKILKMSLFS